MHQYPLDLNIIHCPSHPKEYDMNALSKELELPGAFFLGAAGAPSRILGMNAEVTPIYPHTTGFC